MPKAIDKTKGYRMCCGLSVRGALCWPIREFKRALKWITKEDGKPFASVEELRESLFDELSKGHEKIPLGECDNWDWKEGCQGHPIEDGATL